MASAATAPQGATASRVHCFSSPNAGIHSVRLHPLHPPVFSTFSPSASESHNSFLLSTTLITKYSTVLDSTSIMLSVKGCRAGFPQYSARRSCSTQTIVDDDYLLLDQQHKASYQATLGHSRKDCEAGVSLFSQGQRHKRAFYSTMAQSLGCFVAPLALLDGTRLSPSRGFPDAVHHLPSISHP